MTPQNLVARLKFDISKQLCDACYDLVERRNRRSTYCTNVKKNVQIIITRRCGTEVPRDGRPVLYRCEKWRTVLSNYKAHVYEARQLWLERGAKVP